MFVLLLAWVAYEQPYAIPNHWKMFETKEACIQTATEKALYYVSEHNYVITDAWNNVGNYNIELTTPTGSKETYICAYQSIG